MPEIQCKISVKYIYHFSFYLSMTLLPLYCHMISLGWASLMALGEDGYNKHTTDILETTQAIAKGVQTIKGIRLLGGTPEAMIVCFAGKRCVLLCANYCNLYSGLRL